VVNPAGLLLSHVSTIQKEKVDDKILSGMLTAVQDFVKDSFGDLENGAAEPGGLGKLEYKDTKILIEHGKQTFLAGVIRGEEHPDMRRDLRNTVAEIEKNYKDILTKWEGDIAKVSGIGEQITPLTSRKYRVRKSLEGIKLENERFRIFDRATNLVIELSNQSPVLMIVEDLHWADESSLLLLQYLARNTRSARVNVVCTYRPEDLTDEQKKVIDKMAFEELYTEIELKPLTADEIIRMTQTIFALTDISEEFASTLYENTHGNPFYAKEFLQTLHDEGVIQNINGNWQVGDISRITVPPTIAELVSHRIDRLEDEEISIVEHAAVIGREFTLDFMSKSLKIEQTSLTTYLGKLEKYRIFRLKDREKGIYEFDHSIIREVVYSEMSDRWKRVAHRRVGSTLEEIYRDDIDTVIYQLASHFTNTNERQKAIEYNIRAGDKAMDAFAADESARYYTTAIDILTRLGESEANKKKKLELFDKLGEIYVLAGRYEVGVGCYFDAVKIAEEFDDKLKTAELNRKIGAAYEKIGRYDKSLQYYDTALAAAHAAAQKGAPEPIEVARVYNAVGWTHIRKGEYDKAIEYCQKGLKLAELHNDEKEIATSFHIIGSNYWSKGDYRLALEFLNKGLAIRERISDTRGMFASYNNIGAVYYNKGEFDRALEYYTKSLEIWKKIGTQGIATSYNNIGNVYKNKGELDRALEYHTKSLEIQKKIGDTRGIALSYNNIGSVYMERGGAGNLTAAVEWFEKARDLKEKIGDKSGLCSSYSGLCESHARAGRGGKAVEYGRKALELAREIGAKDRIANSNKVLGIAHREMREWSNAEKCFEESIRVCKEIGRETELAKYYYEYGLMFKRRGTGGDVENARKYLEMALEVFEKRKMMGWVEKVKKALSECDK
jgi:predicted ATPase